MASNRSKIIHKEPFLHLMVTKCFMVRRNSLQLGGDFAVCKNSAVTARLRRENPSFHVLWRTQTSDDEMLFLFLNLSAVPKKSTPGKFAYIRNFQPIGINAAKFEKTRIHFKSDVFTAVAVADAKAP